jgi:aerobic carbon-monoxide dehydrogenase medium subunit
VYLPDVELHAASTLEEASELMTRLGPDARYLAGGTDLLVDLKVGRTTARHLVSIKRIAELRGVSEVNGGLRIGSLATVTELDRSPLVRDRFKPILDATSQMAAPQIRNVATVGGNIVSAVPCADLPPILMALNASVEIWSPDGRRSVPLDSFFKGVRRTALGREEILEAIVVPEMPRGFGAAYSRFALREGNAIAVAAVASSVRRDENGCIADARVVLGAVSPTPCMVKSATDLLVGNALDDDVLNRVADAASLACEPICDVRGTADFRREIVGVLSRRSLICAWERSQESKS